jgi:hypothetical protein
MKHWQSGRSGETALLGNNNKETGVLFEEKDQKKAKNSLIQCYVLHVLKS